MLVELGHAAPWLPMWPEGQTRMHLVAEFVGAFAFVGLGYCCWQIGQKLLPVHSIEAAPLAFVAVEEAEIAVDH